MHYRVVVFGVKDTTAEIVRFVQEKLCPVDLVVTIHPDVLSGNQVSGYEGLSWLEDKYGIPVYETHSYGLKDEETTKFFAENTFELGISMGWQRLLPGFVLSRFSEVYSVSTGTVHICPLGGDARRLTGRSFSEIRVLI